MKNGARGRQSMKGTLRDRKDKKKKKSNNQKSINDIKLMVKRTVTNCKYKSEKGGKKVIGADREDSWRFMD